MKMTTLAKIPFELGKPQIAGPLAVFPILGPEPRLLYASLCDALCNGSFVREVDDEGSVGSVLVANHGYSPMLVYEGEEIQGARQNRTFDSSILVPAGVELQVPVSCVEAGRWERSRRNEQFTPAAHTADPALRRAKRTAANTSARRGEPARANQQEVWAEVASRLQNHAVASSSSALSDIYTVRGHALEELRAVIHHVDGQVGTVLEISGQPVALDLVSRQDVFAQLLPRLGRGYALQAMNERAGKPAQRAAEGFLALALEAHRQYLPTPGIGDGFAISGREIEGSGLTKDGELVALSAFAHGGSPPAA
jgi:hypothetical protein